MFFAVALFFNVLICAYLEAFEALLVILQGTIYIKVNHEDAGTVLPVLCTFPMCLTVETKK